MISEQEQLEAWWESLDDDPRRAALAADVDDLPGWIVAGAVATLVAMDQDPTTDETEDIKARIVPALQGFIAGKRDATDPDR